MPDEKDEASKRNTDDIPFELESQFVLRLPPTPAASLRAALRSGVMNLKERLSIQLEPDTRQGTCKFDKWQLPAKLMELPCVIESHKTLDKKTFYKTADICQILICKEEDDPLPIKPEEEDLSKKKDKKDNKVDKRFLFPHGVTAPLKNVRKRRFRKTLKKKYVDFPEIEKEVKRLFRMDNEAINVRYELLNAEDLEPKQGGEAGSSENNANLLNMDVAEHDIFGEVVSSSDEEDNVLGFEDTTSQSVENNADKQENKTFIYEQGGMNESEYALGEDGYQVEQTPAEMSIKDEQFLIKDEPFLIKDEKKSLIERLEYLEQEISAIQAQRQTQELEIQNIENQALKQRFQAIIENLKKKQDAYQREYNDIYSILQQ